jgi:NTE family protein
MINPLKYLKNRKVGLVLGSGGAKGLAHIAVIEYLEAMGIPIDMIAGSSIGSIIGAIYLTGNLKKFEDDVLKFTKKELLSLIDFTLPKSGIVKGKNFMKLLENYIPVEAKLEDLPKPLSIIATDFYTGRQIVFKKGHIHNAVRASMSIPGVFVPVFYGGDFLIDGGVANPLPIDVVKDMGAGLTIAVNLHPGLPISKSMKNSGKDFKRLNNASSEEIQQVDDKDSNKDSITELDLWYNLADKIKKLNQSKSDKEKYIAPSIFEIISRTIDILSYVNTLNSLNSHKPTVLIEPQLLELGSFDFHEAKNIFIEGYESSSKKRMELLRKVKFWI